MKNMKKTFFASILFGSLLMISACSNEEDTAGIEEIDEVTAEAVVDFVNDDIDNIVMNNIDQIGGVSGASSDSQRFKPFSDRSGCATKSHQEDVQRIVIDFGDGCVGNDDIERSGKIIIEYTDRRNVPGAVVTTTFEDFYVNGNKVEGTRVLTNTSVTTDAQRSFNITVSNGRIIFEDGSERTFEANRTRTWSANRTSDEVILTVTGSSSGTTRDGDAFSMNITTPIVFKNSCRQVGVKVAVQGVRTLSLAGEIRTIDYGDGTCDNLVTITNADGTVEEKEIKNRRKRRRG